MSLTGVEASGPIARADLEAWDHGPANAAFPEDANNKVSLNTRDGRLHVQAQVFALSKVLLATGSTTSVQTEFGSPPVPLDLVVDGGTAAEPLDLDEGDDNGVKVDGLVVRNDTSDSTTTIRAGHTGGEPLRHRGGDHFFLLADMTGIPSGPIRENQLDCDDLTLEVDLPLLGATDVLPFPGDPVIGDICE